MMRLNSAPHDHVNEGAFADFFVQSGFLIILDHSAIIPYPQARINFEYGLALSHIGQQPDLASAHFS